MCMCFGIYPKNGVQYSSLPMQYPKMPIFSLIFISFRANKTNSAIHTCLPSITIPIPNQTIFVFALLLNSFCSLLGGKFFYFNSVPCHWWSTSNYSYFLSKLDLFSNSSLNPTCESNWEIFRRLDDKTYINK